MGIIIYSVVTSLGCLLYHMVTTEAFNCTFETTTCGWTQDRDDDFNWKLTLGDTKTAGTGPSYDHTSGHGYYMYIDSPNTQDLSGQKARLISPAINVTIPMCLVFYYHMYGLHVNTLNVYFSRSGTLGSPVWTKLRSQGDVWRRATIPITGNVTNIVFEGVKGELILADIAIDDVSLQAGTCPQEPYRTVRLVSALNNGIGRIEVYHNGSWGTVCDNGFTEQAAEVACRQLGMMQTWSKPTIANVPGGSGRIWLDNIRCNGNESSLAECDHSPWGSHSCGHSEDVGLNCDSEGLNCTFDINACGWTQSKKFNWTRSTGGVAGEDSLPNFDHTSGSGSYIYIDASYPNKNNDVATFLSPPINGTAAACFTFYYHMFGLKVSALNVYLKKIKSARKLAWTNVLSQEDEWKKAMIQIAEGSPIMQILFRVVPGAGYQGTIAIDDVSLTPGTCHEGEFNCSFDTNACGWTQDQRDDLDWKLNFGATGTAGTGPMNDHTSGHGYYMYMDSPESQDSSGKKARLISPAIHVTTPMCLVFYYHMYGLHINTLNVYFPRSGSLGSPVWTKLRSQGDVWRRATIPITGEVTNIVFEGVQGDLILADIAIDDVSLQAGTCPQDPYRTVRLISPLNNGIGRIEVYHNGSWGTVCDNGFTDQAAEVACRQLGMIKTWSKPTTVSVSRGSGRIWLDNIRCNGNEASLSECDHKPWGSHNCSHSMDVGVNCESEGLNCTFDTNTCGWRRAKTANWTRSSGRPSGEESRPHSDHTTGYGSYIYIETSYDKKNKLDTFRSPPINGTAGACFEFYYHMSGPSISALNVYLKPTKAPNRLLWTNPQSQGNEWKKAVIEIPRGSPIMDIQIKVYRGPSYQGIVAIDDVSVTPGTCYQAEVLLEQYGSGDVPSWNNTIAIVGGVIAVVVVAVIVAVVIYVYRRRRVQSDILVMPQRMRNTKDGLDNPIYDQKNTEADSVSNGEHIQVKSNQNVTWSGHM